MTEIKRPKVSCAIPYHDTPYTDIFLARLLHSLAKQTFRDFEIVLTKAGKMAENSNEAIKRSKGEFVKIMYSDDYFAHENSLKEIVEACKGYWAIAGADNNPKPYWTDDIQTGNNKLGSPSALIFRNKKPLLFDENMSWFLDCDLYRRLYDEHGPPDILEGTHIGIGLHPNQVSNTMSDQDKLKEHDYITKKYEK